MLHRCAGAVLVVLTFGQPLPRAFAEGRPNVVVIFADDLGSSDVGYSGSDSYETPCIDRLAREGMVFRHAYAGAGNCAPSRACLLSGTYTPRHHVYAVGSTARGPKHLFRLEPAVNRSGLDRGNVTLADALKDVGYVTGIFGKWHVGCPDGAEPAEQGFDVVFDSQEGNPNAPRDRPDDPKGIFSITRAAGEFIERNQDRPFFAYVSHHAIHASLEARPGTIERFKPKQTGSLRGSVIRAACIYDFDASVGMLIEKLRSLGLERNTLVIVTSDNGAQRPQEPLRGAKGGYYEGGIRVPFVAYWPGTIAPGICDVPIINQDLYPTLLAAARTSVPQGKVLDGESLIPLFRNEGQLARSAIYWHFPGYLDRAVNRGRETDVRLGFRTRPVTAIRKGDWKLHLFHEEWQLDGGADMLDSNGAVELYNLHDDPGERTNLAHSNDLKRNELLADLLGWLKSTDALVPMVRNPAYDANAAGTARTAPFE